MRYVIAILVGCLFTLSLYVFHWRIEAQRQQLKEEAGIDGQTDVAIKVPDSMLLNLSVDRILYGWRYFFIAVVFIVCLGLARLSEGMRLAKGPAGAATEAVKKGTTPRTSGGT